MENVKKCKNFLSTLIKLASSGKQSTETAANVKELVQHLLDGKIEAEDFTSRLYRELNSSPQPYLVPFLKVRVRPLDRSGVSGGRSGVCSCCRWVCKAEAPCDAASRVLFGGFSGGFEIPGVVAIPRKHRATPGRPVAAGALTRGAPGPQRHQRSPSHRL